MSFGEESDSGHDANKRGVKPLWELGDGGTELILVADGDVRIQFVDRRGVDAFLEVLACRDGVGGGAFVFSVGMERLKL